MTLGVLKPYRRLNIGSQIITELTNNMKDKKDIKVNYFKKGYIFTCLNQ
jgi:hypothetical protein